MDGFEPKAIPKPYEMPAPELARCERVARRETVTALGPSGTGTTHVALGLGLAACRRGHIGEFHHRRRAARRPLRLRRRLAGIGLPIIDESGFAPLSETGAEPPFGPISQRQERGSPTIAGNLPFDEWTGTFGTGDA